MHVTYDLPPEVISCVEGLAETRGLTPSEVAADYLRACRTTTAVEERVRELVSDGLCDAEIAAQMHYLVGRVSDIRRRLRLPANRRYGRIMQ